MMTFTMTTSLLHVVDWTRGSMCLLGVALYHRRLPFAPRPSPRVSEESSRPCRVLQICLRTIWRFFNALLTGRVALGPLCSLHWPFLSICLPWKSPLHLMLIAFAHCQPGDLQVRCAQLSITIEESLFIASYHLHGPSPTSHKSLLS